MVATVANLIVMAIGGAAGASFTYVDAGVTGDITVTGVMVTSALPVIVGAALAVLIARWWRPTIRIAQVIGVALALLTVGSVLMLDTDGATQVALSAMHIVVAPVIYWVLEAGRRYPGADHKA